MGVIGLMNTLAQEGAKYNIRINALAPTAATRMTEGLIPAEALALLTPETVTPAVLYMVSEDAPTRTIIAAGAGSFAVARIVEICRQVVATRGADAGRYRRKLGGDFVNGR